MEQRSTPTTTTTSTSSSTSTGSTSSGSGTATTAPIGLGAAAGFGLRGPFARASANAASAIRATGGRRVGVGDTNLKAPGLAPCAGGETQIETPDPLPASADPDPGTAAAEGGAATAGGAPAASEGAAAAGTEASGGGAAPAAGGSAPAGGDSTSTAGTGHVGSIGLGQTGGAAPSDESAPIGHGTGEDIGPATTPGTLIMTSQTDLRAPSGASNHRTTIGVGEHVLLLVNHAATWTASAGTPATAATATNEFRWVAPAEANTVTVTATSGPRTASITFNVIAPDSMTMTKVGNWDNNIDPGTAGAVMECTILVGPNTVSFGYLNFREIDGPGSNVSGFFERFSASQLAHDASDDWTELKRNNMPPPGRGDTAGLPNLGTTGFREGTLDYVIPIFYRTDDETGDGRRFLRPTQAMRMLADGTVTVSKCGATHSRPPG